MTRFIALIAALALVGCAGYSVSFDTTSTCVDKGEASYGCQIERYQRAP